MFLIFGIGISVLAIAFAVLIVWLAEQATHDSLKPHLPIQSIHIEREDFPDIYYRVKLKDVEFVWRVKHPVPYKSSGYVGDWYDYVQAFDENGKEYRFFVEDVREILPDTLTPYRNIERYE